MQTKDRLIAAIVSQFQRPHGVAGRLVGWEMAVRSSNRKRNRWAVDLLDVEPLDHVLEIGFGPGFAIRELARRASDGKVVGLDHSEVMVRQATARNRAAIDQGRVELHHGPAVDLGEFGEFGDTFDKALAVNNLGMWPDPDARLKDLLCAIRPGGRAAIVTQPRIPGADAATTDLIGQETSQRLERAGFINLRAETLPLRPPVVCVLAETPPGQRT